MTDCMTSLPDDRIEAVARKYDWLNRPSPDVEAWIDAENLRSEAHLERIEGMARIRADLTEILGVENRSLPKTAGGRTFQLRRRPGEEQHSLWVSDDVGERILVSSAELGSITDSIATFSPSPDGAYIVWTASSGGADWQLARIRMVDSGEDIGDELTGMKWPDLAWIDNTSFAYMSWAVPPAGEELTAPNSGATVRVHRLGTDQAADQLIYAPNETTWVIPSVSEDRKWLLLQQLKGIVPATVYRRRLPLDPAGEWETVLDEGGPDTLLGVYRGQTLLLSFRTHSAGRLLAVGMGERMLFEAPDDEPLSDACQLGPVCVLVARTFSGTYLTVVSLEDGQVRQRVALPESRVVHAIDALDGRELAIDLEVIGGARTIERTDLDGLATLAARAEAPLCVETVWATSADGTRVPMRIVRQHGAEPRGDARVLLSVYGGYAIPFLTNGYSSWHLAWVRSGGVLAYAGVRGGGEFGESWHQAARRERKQRGIEDLIACAEWFERSGWSGARQVAINGMSNGGLMTSAALAQQPELFGAVVTEVPVADMVNFHRYTAAHGWIAEFGDPEDPTDYEFLRAYSPLHNICADRRYAPTLVLTADQDDRVPPGPHAYPLAAALRETVDGDQRVFLRVTRNAGHATGRSFNDIVAERSAVLGFSAWGIEQTSSTQPHRNGAAQ